MSLDAVRAKWRAEDAAAAPIIAAVGGALVDLLTRSKTLPEIAKALGVTPYDVARVLDTYAPMLTDRDDPAGARRALIAEAILCGHGYNLTDSCPGCDADAEGEDFGSDSYVCTFDDAAVLW